MSIRMCSAYKTISVEVVGITAGMISPIELLIRERRDRYLGMAKMKVDE